MWGDEDTMSKITDMHLTIHMEKHQNYILQMQRPIRPRKHYSSPGKLHGLSQNNHPLIYLFCRTSFPCSHLLSFLTVCTNISVS